jgi:putative membrane protein insertion efficiency factor/ribonuclease P protein component
MRRGRRVRGSLLHVAHRPNGLEETRVGFSVSRRVGTAVTRNRVKRRLRELVARHDLTAGRDVVIVAQPSAVRASFDDLSVVLAIQLSNAGLERDTTSDNDDSGRSVPSSDAAAPASPLAGEAAPGPAARVALTLIRGYQRLVSPSQPAACRYEPTCSAYAVTAVERHGAVRGSWLAVRRLFRCRPGSEGGYDPVPERFQNGVEA